MSELQNQMLLQRLKDARGRPSELKLQLINLRSQAVGVPIFVLEGDDDRGVYYSWVRYIDSTFKFEPFCCNGKGAVLALKESVDRDVGDLAVGVFFFIDRDFDDARGAAIGGTLYMTDHYSIENYLVNAQVVDEVLKIELNCHGVPELRKTLCGLFDDLYQTFLGISRDINLLLFAIRRFGVQLENDVPRSIGKAVSVSHDSVARLELTPSEFLRPVREISEAELAQVSAEFEALDGRTRYRGKFALSFMLLWLESLARERREQRTELFHGLDPTARTRTDRLSAVTLAPRSAPPESLADFLREKVMAIAG